jgi:hypothetical protein
MKIAFTVIRGLAMMSAGILTLNYILDGGGKAGIS